MKLNRQGSFFGSLILLNVEVLNLVSFLVLSNHVQELTKTMLFQVFLSQVLQVSFREGCGGVDAYFRTIIGDFDLVSEFASLALHFDALSKILGEVRSDEDLILNGL